MSICINCNTVFRDNYCLKRHLNKLKPCKSIKTDTAIDFKNNTDVTNSTLLTEKNKILVEKNIQLTEKIKLLTEKNTCKYCLNIFSRNHNKIIHEMVCKKKDDPVRQLEIEQDIIPILPESKTCCRYCDKELCRPSYLNKHVLICTERKNYLSLLEKNKTTVNNTINNTTNIGTQNNNNFNNITLNINNENYNVINTNKTVDLIRITYNDKSEDCYSLAGQLINLNA